MCWSVHGDALVVGIPVSDRALKVVNKALLHVSISSMLVNVRSLAC